MNRVLNKYSISDQYFDLVNLMVMKLISNFCSTDNSHILCLVLTEYGMVTVTEPL